MFKWLKKNASKLKPLEIYIPTVKTDNITYRGFFEYQCKIKCNVLDSEYYVTVEVYNDLAIPQTRCPCGKILNLFAAPIVKERKLGCQVLRARRGELLELHVGSDHVIRLGKTFRYEVTA